MRTRSWLSVLAGLQLLLVSQAATAVDGRIEINQAKALAGGVTAGDLAGFPVSINTPGSFVLTSDLDVTFLGLPQSANTTAIEITLGVSGTSIDLNGFAIRGPDSAGTGAGVSGEADVRNGSVLGMGSDGIQGSGSVDSVRATGNKGWGIKVSFGHVTRCVAAVNTVGGISVSNGAIADSLAIQNLGPGIQLNGGTAENVTTQNNVGVEVNLLGARLGHSTIAENAAADFTCSVCALEGNKFNGCAGAGCFGAGTILQVPPASNMCGNVVCP
jgi:hypothetical protein